jgi:hypothetical protein
MSWILCQPFTYFKSDDFNRASLEGDFILSNDQEHITFSISETQSTFSSGLLTYHKFSSAHDLNIKIEATVNEGHQWIKFFSIESIKEFPDQLPRLHISSLVIRLISKFGGGWDSELPIGISSIKLKETKADRNIARSIFEQTLKCALPIIYISASEKDKYALIPDRLARNLCGAAHVVVEPSRLFSRRLRHEVDSRNIYGGMIGVYWPSGAGATLFRRGSQDVKIFEHSIINEVFRASSTCGGKTYESVHFKQNF